MRTKIMATLFVMMALVGATNAAATPTLDTETKANEVTIIASDCLAAAGTPTGAVAYLAAQARWAPQAR